jgi:hypothetical protein
MIRGGGFNGAQFVRGSLAKIGCPATGPCFHIGEGQAIRLENLMLVGRGIAVLVHTASVVQFESVSFIATTDVDGIDTSPFGCDGCNVNLGSSNAALVIVNSYWITFSHCAFTFYPNYRSNGTVTSTAEMGVSDAYPGTLLTLSHTSLKLPQQRPSVILRGEAPGPGVADTQTNTVYLVNFQHSVFSGGGVQCECASAVITLAAPSVALSFLALILSWLYCM